MNIKFSYHFLHEFHSIEETPEGSVSNDTIDNFIKIISAAKATFSPATCIL